MPTQLILYGEKLPGVDRLLSDPAIKDLTGELLKSSPADCPDELPSSFASALELGLFARDGDVYREGPLLVPIPKIADQILHERVPHIMAHYVGLTEDVAFELRQAWDGLRVAEQYSFEDLQHTLIAAMFLDQAMGNEMIRIGEITHKPTSGTVVWAFEQISGENAYGVQSLVSESRRAFYAQMWHRTVKRNDLKFSPKMVDHLAHLAEGGEAGALPSEELFLRSLGVLKTVDGALRVNVPVFCAEDTERLLSILLPNADELVGQILMPALDLLQTLEWWSERADQEAYRHAAVRLLLEYGIEYTVRAGALPPFPVGKVDPSWGRYLWLEGDGEQTLIPGGLPEEDAAA